MIIIILLFFSYHLLQVHRYNFINKIVVSNTKADIQMKKSKANSFNSPNNPKIVNSLSVSQIEPVKTPFTFQSQENSIEKSNIAYSEKQYRQDHCHYDNFNDQKYYQTEDRTNDDEIRKQCQNQYKLKLESVIRGYEMKLDKERQTYQLAQKKYKEEIQYLQKQIKQLINVRSYQPTPKQQQTICRLCSNGEIITHMKTMLEMLESDHNDCLRKKCEMNDSINNLQTKIAIMEMEEQKSDGMIVKLRNDIKTLRIDKDVLEREKRERDREIRELEMQFHVKEVAIRQQLEKQRVLRLEEEEKLIQYLSHTQSAEKENIYNQSLSKQKKSMFRQSYTKNYGHTDPYLSRPKKLRNQEFMIQDTHLIPPAPLAPSNQYWASNIDTFRPAPRKYTYQH